LDPKLPDAISTALPSFAEALIDDATALGYTCPTVQEMDIVCHTGGPRIVQEVCSGLGVAESALESTRKVMIHHGNLSGSSNMAVLDVHNRDCAADYTDDKWALCLSMGPGVCIEGILMRRLCQLKSTVDPRKVSALAQRASSARAGLPTLLRRHSSFAESDKTR